MISADDFTSWKSVNFYQMKNPELRSPGFSLTLITNLNLIYEKKLSVFYITNVVCRNAKRIELKLRKLKNSFVYFLF
ncbi:hypothetical protein BZG01_13200 [Labilibaculum manganireducens]|uniref:Uncharacterized protein n=1 Tax=Labilibaculum manganireducens TaxID=1940525 RepID=A0A2N3I530_9BACT|nr:hypothetical protein BZG01_13200 [Labilibaculum manganireducens]